MTKKEQFYILAIFAHVGMGVLFFSLPFLGYIYGLLIFVVGIFYVINTRNKNNEVLLMAAYFTGIDVYLKMIDAIILNEYGKYTVMVFMVLGIFYKGFSKGAFLYIFFMCLLVPSIFIGAETLSFDANIRKAIAFNITGPACLGICAVYCFQRSITFARLKDILTMLMLPLIAMLVNLFLYTPSIKEVIRSTESSFAASGGFGPNQVSTVLGLAMFIAFVQFLFSSKSKLMLIVNAALVTLFAFRCIVTFSRGGMITGLIMMALLLLLMYRVMSTPAKLKIVLITGATVFAAVLIWGYTSVQTSGLLDKRYANQNAKGVQKESFLTGRELLIKSELSMFLDHPFFGVGVGKNKEIRLEETGVKAASHNEVTRLLGEHGSLGLIALCILFFTPIILYFSNQSQIFALIFMVFWLLTISHAAMRIAAPAFVYSLALLRVKFLEE